MGALLPHGRAAGALGRAEVIDSRGFSPTEAASGPAPGRRQRLSLASLVARPCASPASVASINGSTWAQARTAIEHLVDGGSRDDVYLIQETRFLTQAAMETARGWGERNGLNAGFSTCSSTGSSVQAVSSGVGILAATHRGFAPVGQEWGQHSSRILARRVAFGDLVVVVVSLYLEHSVKVTGMNVDILGELQTFLNELSEPFIVGADWNMEPQTLESSWWTRAVGGAVVAPPFPTCDGRIYDYFVISAALAALGPQVEALRPATTHPHVPVRLQFSQLGALATVWTLLQPRPSTRPRWSSQRTS